MLAAGYEDLRRGRRATVPRSKRGSPVTAPPWRSPSSYVAGVDGPVVVVPGRVAAWLERYADLRRLRTDSRGVDPEVDSVLIALATAAALWRQQRTGADHGTELGKQAEPRSEFVTTAQAATLLRITERGVRKACAEGRLPATRHGDIWSISREDVEHYRAARRAA
jgi:excisionase family DNA binding protein